MLLAGLFFARHQPKVKVQEQVCQHDFNLCCCKESPGTCPNAVAEVDVVDARCSMLVLLLLPRLLSQSLKAKRVEFRRFGVELRILVDGMAQDCDERSLWDGMPCRQLEAVWISNDARNVD